MSGFVSCATLTAALADKQDKLTNCAGAPLTGSVPTCAEVEDLVDEGIDAFKATAINVLANDGSTVLFKGIPA